MSPGAVVGLTSGIVVLVLTLAAAVAGIVAKARADELEKKLALVEKARQDENEQCAKSIAELSRRVDDLTNGWLERLAPQVSRIMAPLIVEDLKPSITDAIREAQR